MLLYLSCLWMCGILSVHTAAQHPSRREERGALRSWKRQSAGTPTPMRAPEPVKGTGEKLSGRRAPLSGWAGGRTSRVVGLYFFVQTSVASYYRSARVYVAQWMQLEFIWIHLFVCFYSASKWKCVFNFIQGKSYVSVKYTGIVDQIWLNVGYFYQKLRKSLVLLSYCWLM